MTVVNQAGTPLNNGDTVFLGDQVTITPSVNPSPANQPLTGFGWNFDFDFHASEDNGAAASPRLKAPDTTAFGSQSPPAPITVVGPCDPRAGGDPRKRRGLLELGHDERGVRRSRTSRAARRRVPRRP